MAEITIVRQQAAAISEQDAAVARRVIFGIVDGLGEQGRSQWRRLWSGLMRLEPGEMLTIVSHLPRSGRFHRRHMALEQAVFEAQERFTEFEQFRCWLKVGAGWVTWAAGPAGGVVPIPRSISYAKADEVEFGQYHAQVVRFLRGLHAARYLWPHMRDGKADAMMDSILEGFQE